MRIRCPECRAIVKFNGNRIPRFAECPKCEAEFDPRDADELRDEEYERRPRKRRRTAKEASTVPWLWIGIGSGTAVALVVVLILLLASKKSTPPSGDADTVAQNDSKVEPAQKTQPPDRPAKAPAPNLKQPPKKAAPDDFMFEDPPDRPAPRMLVPVLQRTQTVDFDPPRLNVLKRRMTKGTPPAVPGDQGKMSLEEVKRATTFIMVDAGADSASGSGFVMMTEGDGGLVATNCHVVAPAIIAALRDPKQTTKIDVVFDSGLPTEQSVRGDVAGFDFDSDLALLHVAGVARMPRPIDPRYTPALKETTPVMICGFPFGEHLSTSSRHPTVTIGKGTISSLRLDDDGELARVQIDGALNPGNSGGPIVDNDGRLIGIAVATIRGSGIGLAIPVSDLNAVLEGRVYSPVIQPGGIEGDQAVFQVVVPVVDPLRKIEALDLCLSSNAPVPTAPESDGRWKLIPSDSQLNLPFEGRARATAQLRLPAKNHTVTTLQLVYRHKSGEAIASRPVSFRLDVNAVQTAADAVPIQLVDIDPEKYEGKVVVLRGTLFPVVIMRGNIYELQVGGENSPKPLNLNFRTTYDIKTQMSELPRIEQSLPARFTGRVGKADRNGRYTVYVTRIDFLGRGNRVVKTIPSDVGQEDHLIALNRKPEKYIDQTLTFTGLLSPGVVMSGQERELTMLLPTHRRPDNLHFTTDRRIATQVHSENWKAAQPVRVTARVETRTAGNNPSGRRYVTILKIEVLDHAGKTVKVLE